MTPASRGRIDECLRELEEDAHQLHAMADAATLCGFSALGRQIRCRMESVSRIRGRLEEEVAAIASARYEPANFMLDFLRDFPGIPSAEVTFNVSDGGEWCITVKMAGDPRILQATGESLDEAISKIVAMK
ncbi:MAG: hypothetical protein E6Q97_20005 [Desulfurellales bacterium]|nr:MAG: hypothetical protein E6Q97_20005 [Desulfurellales bacterium]